jgi:hypothetical protein
MFSGVRLAGLVCVPIEPTGASRWRTFVRISWSVPFA